LEFDMTRILLPRTLLAMAALGASAVAHAQYAPGPTGDLGAGMGQTALGQSTMSGTRQIGANKRAPGELSPTMQKYCAKWPKEGVCRHAAQQRAAAAAQNGKAPQR
jgi:hypothetical protein